MPSTRQPPPVPRTSTFALSAFGVTLMIRRSSPDLHGEAAAAAPGSRPAVSVAGLADLRRLPLEGPAIHQPALILLRPGRRLTRRLSARAMAGLGRSPSCRRSRLFSAKAPLVCSSGRCTTPVGRRRLRPAEYWERHRRYGGEAARIDRQFACRPTAGRMPRASATDRAVGCQLRNMHASFSGSGLLIGPSRRRVKSTSSHRSSAHGDAVRWRSRSG